MLSGPYGAMILADLGADTIKVEPLQGEGTRKLLATDPDNSLDGMGAYYITLNRNKRSVAIDLKSPSGPRGVLRPGARGRRGDQQFRGGRARAPGHGFRNA